MSAVLLLLALVCFVVETFGGDIAGLDLIALGSAFFVASFLVGPVTEYISRRP